jgi:hypothetical protein
MSGLGGIASGSVGPALACGPGVKVAPWLTANPVLLSKGPVAEAVGGQLAPSVLRVGFVSRFFGVMEPHGLLLDGVMDRLPRSHFRVVSPARIIVMNNIIIVSGSSHRDSNCTSRSGGSFCLTQPWLCFGSSGPISVEPRD